MGRRRRRIIRWLSGCGCNVVFFGGIVCCGLGSTGYALLAPYIAWVQSLNDRGYAFQGAETLELTSRDDPTAFFAREVVVTGEVDDVAFLVEIARIEGRVDGDIEFLGRELIIEPSGVVTGDIRVQGAERVSVKGEVGGEITGEWGFLDSGS